MDLLMDAKEYARKVDLLIQIRRSIYDKAPILMQPAGEMALEQLHLAIENAIRKVEHLAWLDSKGYLQ
jgi:hypothetical protein